MNALLAHLPVMPVLVPLLTVPFVILLANRELAWAAATAASLFSFAVAAQLAGMVMDGGVIGYALGGWPAPFGIELAIDGFSALLLLVTTGASSAGLLIARVGTGFELSGHRTPLVYAAWLLALAGLSGILITGDAFNVFVFMEISSLATYILIAAGSDRRALPAVFKYLVMGTIGATFYLIGVGLVYMMTGTLNLTDMAERIVAVADTDTIFVACGFITVGLALKAAMFPLHTWLPNAYTYSPHAVTVFIAACSTKVSLYVLLRFDYMVFQPAVTGHALLFTDYMLALGILAIVVASCLAFFEKQLKRLFAYSSVAQIGYMVFGAGLVSVAGLTGGIVHMFNHALAKGAIFVAIAAMATRGLTLTVDGVRGAARRMPLTFAGFVGAALSLIGLPGTAGFIGKWYLVQGAVQMGPLGLVLVVPVLAGSLLAVFYVWKIVESAYTPVATADGAPPPREEAPAPVLLVLGVLVAANVWFGFQPQVPLALAGSAAEALLSGRFGG